MCIFDYRRYGNMVWYTSLSPDTVMNEKVKAKKEKLFARSNVVFQGYKIRFASSRGKRNIFVPSCFFERSNFIGYECVVTKVHFRV